MNNLVTLKPEESVEWFTVHEGAQGDPVVCFRWKLKGTFQEIMELHKFPFDVQNLTVEIRSGCGRLTTRQMACCSSRISTQSAPILSQHPQHPCAASRVYVSLLCVHYMCWPILCRGTGI